MWKAPGDGSCFYHCVKRFTGHSVTALRASVAHAITHWQNEKFNGMSLADWIRHETSWTIPQYVYAVRNGLWGGATEMFILSNILQRPFVVYGTPKVHGQSMTATKLYEIQSSIASQCSPGGPIMLLYKGSNHYDALITVARQK